MNGFQKNHFKDIGQGFSDTQLKYLLIAGTIVLVLINVVFFFIPKGNVAQAGAAAQTEEEQKTEQNAAKDTAALPAQNGIQNTNAQSNTSSQSSLSEDFQITRGQEYLDALGEKNKQSILIALKTFLNGMGYYSKGQIIEVPRASQSLESTGEVVIWIVVPNAGAAVTVQGTPDGRFGCGWLDSDAAKNLGISIPPKTTTENANQDIALYDTSEVDSKMEASLGNLLVNSFSEYAAVEDTRIIVQDAYIPQSSFEHVADTIQFTIVCPCAGENQEVQIIVDAVYNTQTNQFSFSKRSA